MPLTLDTLAILDAIDRRGSFARAAEALERAPSSLTYAVQQLEADLDVLVFDRSGHRARLTVPDLATKLLAQQQGLGVANVPRWTFESPAASGLMAKEMAAGSLHDLLYLAWRSGDSGRALAWFIQRLSQADIFDGVLDAV